MPTATAAKVVDASALAALIFGEPEGAAMAEQLRGQLVAPDVLGDVRMHLGPVRAVEAAGHRHEAPPQQVEVGQAALDQRHELVEAERGRVRVALTREDDRYLSLQQRPDIARRLGATLFAGTAFDLLAR